LKGLKFSKDQGIDFTKFNSVVMSRIYPKGLRIDSSNYNPMPYWYCGSQVVALNYQTFDINLKLNEGRFQKNGRTGYIIKPDCMRKLGNNEITWKGCSEMPPTKSIRIHIISAWRLSNLIAKNVKDDLKNVSCKVRLSLYSGHVEIQPFESELIKDNLLNPRVDLDQCFNVFHEELDMLMFEITDKDGSEVYAYYSIPVDCVRTGYRTVPLKDNDYGRNTVSELFVKVYPLKNI